jgi:hypothetical protein
MVHRQKLKLAPLRLHGAVFVVLGIAMDPRLVG